MNELVSAPWSINLRERVKALYLGAYAVLATYGMSIYSAPNFSFIEALSNWRQILLGGIGAIVIYGLQTLISGLKDSEPAIMAEISPIILGSKTPLDHVVVSAPIVEKPIVEAPTVASPTPFVPTPIV